MNIWQVLLYIEVYKRFNIHFRSSIKSGSIIVKYLGWWVRGLALKAEGSRNNSAGI